LNCFQIEKIFLAGLALSLNRKSAQAGAFDKPEQEYIMVIDYQNCWPFFKLGISYV